MLRLVKVSKEYERQYKDMLDEWKRSGEKIIPFSIRRDYSDFDELVRRFEEDEKGINIGNFVPSITFLGYDDERDIVVGAVNIRPNLNEKLRYNGGHIGDGVRPSERRKGYATEMIRLALQFCKNELGLNRVMMVCLKENIGSAKAIINNGGILEREVLDENRNIDQVYWIDL